MSGSWIEQAERALDGGAKDESIRVLRGARPRVLDQEGFKALLAPLLAALIWAAAVLREIVAGSSLDPMALIFRLIALGLTLRVLILGVRLAKRVKVWLHARAHALVLTPEGLFYRSPEVDVVVPKEDVIGVMERGQWQTRKSGRRWSEVYVVSNPATGRTHLELPPVFESTPGQLAERLMRWRGSPAASPERVPEDSDALPSAIWDDATRGKAAAGTTVLRHGWAWLQTVPYAGALVSIIAVEGLLRAGPSTLDALGPLVGAGLVVTLVLVPARWLHMYRKEVRPGRGVAMVLTPTEILMRWHAGMLRTRYEDLATVRTDQKRVWSVLEGAHEERELVLTRTNAPFIRYPEPNLGVPLEVVQILIEAYRSHALPRPQATPQRMARAEEEE